ncbi:MAG: histidine phosphatase family protein [Gammaproteobacteria bacterium]|nr:histidine phosphatase family protein [Gammaproteobacteria bacterium]
MAIQIYLVRHGEAEAGWDVDPDPALSARGREQAEMARDCLVTAGPLPLLSSPLRRARQTAQPLAQAWQTAVGIEPAFREIPAPAHLGMQDRIGWLLSVRDLDWSQADSELWQWRDAIVSRLVSVQSPTVIFTHFMVLNLVAGLASGCSQLVHYQPANGSILTIAAEEGRFRVVNWGQQAESRVL